MKEIICNTFRCLGIDIKIFVRKFRYLGIDIRRFVWDYAPGSTSRPIGNIRQFLEDVSARGFHPRGIIDVGANRGNWTIMAKEIFPDANVIMIEPLDEMKEILENLCRTHEDLEYIKAGAGKESGELVQTIWEDLVGSSFLPIVDDEKIKRGKQRKTRIVAIDDILKDKSSFFPDLVKLDVQGFELEAIKGGQSLFGKTELFIMETSLYCFMEGTPTTADCIAFMNERGYDLYDVTDFLRRPKDGALGQIDLAFALRGGRLNHSNNWDA
jgi:FkbM family methyltransferase